MWGSRCWDLHVSLARERKDPRTLPLLPANELAAAHTHLVCSFLLHQHGCAHTATPTHHIDQGCAPRVAVRPVSQPLRTKRLRTRCCPPGLRPLHSPAQLCTENTKIRICKHADASSVFRAELDLDAAPPPLKLPKKHFAIATTHMVTLNELSLRFCYMFQQ